MTVHNVLLPAGCSRRFSSEIEALSSDFGKSESDIAGNEQRTNPVSDSSNEASADALRRAFEGHENGKDMRRVMEEEARKTKAAKEQRDRVKANEETTSW